jgi:phage terminase large subunit
LSSLSSTALVTWNKYVIPEGKQAGIVDYYGGSAEEPAQYRYANGSAVVIGGLDHDTKIMSSEYDMIYVQEAIELNEGSWEALTTRLRNGRMPYQQLIGDTNPSHPTHWIKLRSAAGKLVILESRHEDNPVLFDVTGKITEVGKSYIAKLDNLTGVRYYRLRRGLWVAAEGTIYDTFDPAVHVIKSFPVPEEWTRFWAVDFGFIHPMVIQFWAENPDGRLYLYREIFQTKKLVSDMGSLALSYVTDANGKWTEPKPSAIICDHDAENREQFAKAVGLRTQPAVKKVLEGIQATQNRLKPRDDGKPGLYIFENCLTNRDPELVDSKQPTGVLEEISGYVWQDKGKEAPVKEHDDGCDALRYMVAHRDLGKKSYNVRWL